MHYRQCRHSVDTLYSVVYTLNTAEFIFAKIYAKRVNDFRISTIFPIKASLLIRLALCLLLFSIRLFVLYFTKNLKRCVCLTLPFGLKLKLKLSLCSFSVSPLKGATYRGYPDRMIITLDLKKFKTKAFDGAQNWQSSALGHHHLSSKMRFLRDLLWISFEPTVLYPTIWPG